MFSRHWWERHCWVVTFYREHERNTFNFSRKTTGRTLMPWIDRQCFYLRSTAFLIIWKAMGLNEMSFQFIMVVAMASVLVAVVTRTSAITLAKPGCPSSCGDVAIPYPFGTSPNCSLNENFQIRCNNFFNPPKPFLLNGNIDFTNISFDGELQITDFVARDCFRKNKSEDQNQPALTLFELTISSTKNVFIES